MSSMKPNDPQGKNSNQQRQQTSGSSMSGGASAGNKQPGMQDKNRQQKPNQPWGTDTKK